MARPIRYPLEIFPGVRFGRLEVLGTAFRAAVSKRPTWCCVVRCECGRPPDVICTSSLTGGLTRSCGCLRRELVGAKRRTHGGSTDGLCRIWYDIRKRCRDDGCSAFKNYGGRGITIDPQWDTYESFRDWSLANGYAEGLQIDRIDNDGPYSPDNCRWTTRKVNMRNMRRNTVLTAFGERKTMVEWAEDARCQVGYSTLRERIKVGVRPEVAILTPPTTAKKPLDGSLR